MTKKNVTNAKVTKMKSKNETPSRKEMFEKVVLLNLKDTIKADINGLKKATGIIKVRNIANQASYPDLNEDVERDRKNYILRIAYEQAKCITKHIEEVLSEIKFEDFMKIEKNIFVHENKYIDNDDLGLCVKEHYEWRENNGNFNIFAQDDMIRSLINESFSHSYMELIVGYIKQLNNCKE